MKSALILTPVLGISWIFGYFYLSESTVVFDYLFAIAIGFQGTFMLCYHLFVNAEVKAAIKRRSLAKQRIKSIALALGNMRTPTIVVTDVDGHNRSARSSVSDNFTYQVDWKARWHVDQEFAQAPNYANFAKAVRLVYYSAVCRRLL